MESYGHAQAVLDILRKHNEPIRREAMKPVNLDSYEQWRFVQDWLSGWMLRHKNIDPEDLEKFESVIEMIQEGQPARPGERWTPPDPDNWMFPPEGP